MPAGNELVLLSVELRKVCGQGKMIGSSRKVVGRAGVSKMKLGDLKPKSP